MAYIVITSNRWLLLFLCAITPFQSSGVSEDMPQEDGGHVIESWRVTTGARVFTANAPKLAFACPLVGAPKATNETKEHFKRST